MELTALNFFKFHFIVYFFSHFVVKKLLINESSMIICNSNNLIVDLAFYLQNLFPFHLEGMNR